MDASGAPPARQLRLRGFWVGLAQLPRSHPFTVRRLERLYQVGLFRGEARAVPTQV